MAVEVRCAVDAERQNVHFAVADADHGKRTCFPQGLHEQVGDLAVVRIGNNRQGHPRIGVDDARRKQMLGMAAYPPRHDLDFVLRDRTRADTLWSALRPA